MQSSARFPLRLCRSCARTRHIAANNSFFKMMPAIVDINGDDNGASELYAYSTVQRGINVPINISMLLITDFACFGRLRPIRT
jgi:hypothetical protein